ncbi:hypothetical protein CFE70_001381 [Pyrenophora teres f. teres 0-1]
MNFVQTTTVVTPTADVTKPAARPDANANADTDTQTRYPRRRHVHCQLLAQLPVDRSILQHCATADEDAMIMPSSSHRPLPSPSSNGPPPSSSSNGPLPPPSSTDVRTSDLHRGQQLFQPLVVGLLSDLLEEVFMVRIELAIPDALVEGFELLELILDERFLADCQILGEEQGASDDVETRHHESPALQLASIQSMEMGMEFVLEKAKVVLCCKE